MLIGPASPDMSDPASPLVLIVDDNLDILPEYQEILELEGIASLISSDPLEAVSLALLKDQLRLIITDLHMEKLDGFGLITQIRSRISPERNLSFIILTGDVSCAHHQTFPEVPVLLKPVSLTSLVAEIRAQLA